ncbi:MAG: lipocalin-like domain-containing protein [Candidatus Thorarchaeota archaeon]
MVDIVSPRVKEGWNGPGRGDREITPLTPEDDALHIEVGEKGQYEWWYFDAHLEDGSTIVAFFYAAYPNPGLDEGKIGVELTLLRPDGRKTQHFIKYDKSELNASSEVAAVTIGKNYLKVDYDKGELPVYEIFLDEEDLGFHLTYTATVKGWKPGDGYAYFQDKGRFAWVIPFPRARVEGSIRDGDTTKEVTGVGYHDHNWLTFPFSRMIEYWMWGRIYSENFTVSYAYIRCNNAVDNHTIKTLMLAKGPEPIVSTGEFDFSPEDFEYNEKNGHYFPNNLTISVPEKFDAILKVKRIFESVDMLDNFNPILRFLAKYLLRIKPGYFRLNSEFTLTVNHGGQTYEEKGSTLHEIVAFRPIVQEAE